MAPLVHATSGTPNCKIHIFWEGHKILWNLHRRFDCVYIGQICLLRMYELYLICILLQRFFRYHDHMFNKALHEKKRRSAVHVMPYGLIFKQCFPQCFNVFFTYFVTLTIFPAVLAGISYLSKLYSIFILNEYWRIKCQLIWDFFVCDFKGQLKFRMDIFSSLFFRR